MAVAEGQVERNPALLLFTPKEATKPVRRAMTIKEVQICFGALDQRERLIAKLAIIGRDASRRNLRPDMGPVDRNLCGYPAAGLSRR